MICGRGETKDRHDEVKKNLYIKKYIKYSTNDSDLPLLYNTSKKKKYMKKKIEIT